MLTIFKFTMLKRIEKLIIITSQLLSRRVLQITGCDKATNRITTFIKVVKIENKKTFSLSKYL